MTTWRDATSYSRNEAERIPRTWEARIGHRRLYVTRHRDHGPDAWCMTWLGDEPRAIAHGVTAEAAQRVALDLAAADLLAMIRDVDALRGKR